MFTHTARNGLHIAVENAIFAARRQTRFRGLITSSPKLVAGFGSGIATRVDMAASELAESQSAPTASVMKPFGDLCPPACNWTISAASVAASIPTTWKRSRLRKTPEGGIAGCANSRIEEAYRQPRLFAEPRPQPVQEVML